MLGTQNVDDFLSYFMAASIISIVVFMAGCVCCRKKIPKNELLGLEGLVKLTNPEEKLTNRNSVVSVEQNAMTKSQLELDLRRASNAPHRSLPDIPITDQLGDNNSELYATVGDKVLEKPQGNSPNSSKNKSSVSQHSSLSQADDIISPYARVKSPLHNYDKVRHTEHPYAQLNQVGKTNIETISERPSSTLSSPTNLNQAQNLEGESRDQIDNIESVEDSHEIPAASAIAGHIAASQELPYMTPPIGQLAQHNFSGDSQDSSKGYTSISVREPLANIIAQTNKNNIRVRRELSDSHYATVSDDSDEMYAAIDDPNNQRDLYTSGSETYAQIQPQNPSEIVVSVEINSVSTVQQETQSSVISQRARTNDLKTSVQSEVYSETLNTQVHSRQASSSSCASSVGILGSPKPEKRQANSPLPPTPLAKLQSDSQYPSNSSSSINSDRNSIEVGGIKCLSKENINSNLRGSKKSIIDEGNMKKKNSPSKDLEEMYAKVMKKNKLSSLPSQETSPNMTRKIEKYDENLSTSDSNVHIFSKLDKKSDNNYETIDKKRIRNNFQQKDSDYEKIPGDSFDKSNTSLITGALSQGIQEISNNVNSFPNKADIDCLKQSVVIENKEEEPGYEIVPENVPVFRCKKLVNNLQRNSSEYDPNYEVLRPTDSEKFCSDDGYAKILEKKSANNDNTEEIIEKSIDGYSRVKSIKEIDEIDGYSVVKEKVKNHDYASISETKGDKTYTSENRIKKEDECSDIYSSIASTTDTLGYSKISESPSVDDHNYSIIVDTITSNNSLLDSLTPIITTATSSPGFSSVSECRTTPSTDSVNSDTIFGYQSSSNRNLYQQQNYGVNTESESEPNYESVKYIKSTENPYERLHNEKSPEPLPISYKLSDDLKNNDESNINKSEQMITNDNQEVGDYFQV